MKDFYMVTGRYDMVVICEAPEEGVLARALLSVTSKAGITSGRTDATRRWREA